MSLDAFSIIEGATSGMVAQKTLDTVQPDKTNEDIVNAVRSLEGVLIDLHNELFNRLSSFLSPEQRTIVTFYKESHGPFFIPNPQNLLYTRILVPVATILSVVSSIGTFTFQPTPGIWESLDFPDSTKILLDSTNTVDYQSVFIRYTNVPPQN